MVKGAFVILLSVFLFLSFLYFAAASSLESANYSVGSYFTSLGGGETSGRNYSFVFSFDPIMTSEISGRNYTAVSGFSFPFPNFMSANSSQGGTNSTGTSPGSSSGGSSSSLSGGGSLGEVSSGCNYDWVCSDWYPSPCPSNGIQNEVCVNKGTCSGNKSMPPTERNCTPSNISLNQPLFDISVDVPLGSRIVAPGESLKFYVKATNKHSTPQLDVLFKYWISNSNGKLILERQETRAVNGSISFNSNFTLPEDIATGTYKIFTEIKYGNNQTALSQDSFQVVNKGYDIFIKIVRIVVIAIVIDAFLLLVVWILVLLERRFFGKKKRKFKSKRRKRH